VIDDYGHHPVEIKAVLAAAREGATGRVIAVVQPHRYTRLRDLMDEFQGAFNDADIVYVAPVYAAGEEPIEGADAEALVEGLKQRGHRAVRKVDGPEELARQLRDIAARGDMVICLGAGRHHQVGCGSRRRHQAFEAQQVSAEGSSALRSAPSGVPGLAGAAEPGGSLADFIWFRTGGPAEWLVRPKDVADLSGFLRDLDPAVPVMPVGVGSNLIVRDGGVPGVVVRLPKASPKLRSSPATGCAPARGQWGSRSRPRARDAGIAGLEFMRGIPGTAGGAVRMNAGAYGRDVSDILIEATLVLRDGSVETWPAARFGLHLPPQRHAARRDRRRSPVRGRARRPGDDRRGDGPHRRRARGEPAASQPHGGSTFKNPPESKAWQLIDAAGLAAVCRSVMHKSLKSIATSCSIWAMLARAISKRWARDVRRRVPGAFGCRAGMGNPARGG
jgi:UDP-N-acetylmuramate dehydrogenase